MAKILVSGGDFERTDGFLAFIDLNEKTGELNLEQEVWINHPYPEMAVRGKGITGLYVKEEYAWACFSNVVVKVSVADSAVVEVFKDDSFSDLHQLEYHSDKVFVANTGNESVDIISPIDRSIERIDFLGELRATRPNTSQTKDTKPHLHHISSVCVNNAGNILIALGRQTRVLNLTKWEWIGGLIGAPVHDIHCSEDNSIWCTSINGKIFKIAPNGESQVWNLADHFNEIGWTRGLALTRNGMVVGITAIRESNHQYFQSFFNSGSGQVDASLTWVPWDGSRCSRFVFPHASTRKVFSIKLLT